MRSSGTHESAERATPKRHREGSHCEAITVVLYRLGEAHGGTNGSAAGTNGVNANGVKPANGAHEAANGSSGAAGSEPTNGSPAHGPIVVGSPAIGSRCDGAPAAPVRDAVDLTLDVEAEEDDDTGGGADGR